ncbi:MAG TPA: serine--tRNA ligase [Opitutales bacterium]|nr:serine--tRNA ligase [Opitutales bacterium]
MIDTKLLRENPEQVREAIQAKGDDCDLDAVLETDFIWRTRLAEVERLRADQKAANKEMAALQKGSPEFLAKVKEMQAFAAEVKEKEAELRQVEERWKQMMLTIPNIPHESVPVAPDPEGNVVHSTWGDPDAVSPHAVAHFDLPWFSESFDFARGAKVTGAGFPFYVGDGARLVRSLVSFFLDEATALGYREVLPPLFVNEASATATGQLPDKEGQMYETITGPLFAIPTSEVPVTNFFRDEILSEKDLPQKFCAYSPCFRREAGSYGKDVRGLNRLHQFDKVELVKWVHPEKSYEELELLREDAENLLKKLELPYRVLLMCTGDLGFTPAKKYDLEVWAGGQKRWLEVSSCSNFEAFQARRAGIRFRDAEGKVEPLHTLNGSGLAIPRVLAAILENNVQADGSVRIPKILQERFGAESMGAVDS